MKFRCWTIRRLSIALLAVMTLGGAWAQIPPAGEPAPALGPLTVDEAVALALRQNPAITFAEQNVLIAQDQVSAARAGALPTVGINSTATYVPSPTSVEFEGKKVQTGNALSASAQVSVSQPVWPASRWRAPINAAQANVGLNDESLRRTRQQVVYQTRQAFYQLLTAQELVRAAQNAVDVAQTQVNVANATFEAGTAPRLDVEQARATLADAQVSLVRAQNGVELSRASLATQIGLPAGTAITITAPEGLPAASATVDPLIAQALSLRPELAQLNYQRQRLRANIALVRLQQQPLVNVQAGYNQTLLGGSLFGSDGLSFSAALSWNVYNGGRTRAELSAAQRQLEQVDTNARQLELNITLDVRQAWLNMNNALRQLDAAQQQLTAATEAERISRLRYENGEGILLEWEQAQLRSTQAQTNLAEARYQAQVAAAQLEFAIGSPVPAPANVPVAAPAG